MDKASQHEIKLATGKSETYRIAHLVSRSYVLHTHLLPLEKEDKLKLNRLHLRISVNVSDSKGDPFYSFEEELHCKHSIVASLVSFEVHPPQVLKYFLNSKSSF